METSAQKQIDFYINIPSSIKGAYSALQEESIFKPAHVVNGMITIKNGALNMPSLNSRPNKRTHC